jgi:hypothetical protein
VAADSDKPLEIDLYRDVVLLAVLLVRQTFRVGQPARVKTPYRPTTRADVSFPVRWLATNLTVMEDPPAPALPVLLPRGGGYGVHFDLRAGDLGVAVACDGPVSGLYDSGQDVTPQFPQGHDYGCAVFLPGGRVSNEAVPTQPPNHAGTMTVGAEDGTATLTLRGLGLPSAAELGSVVLAASGPAASLLLGSETAANPVACAIQTAANFQAINTTIQGLPVVPGDPGVIPALKTAFAAYALALQNVADAKARVDGPA